jgi:hypothetical protein
MCPMILQPNRRQIDSLLERSIQEANRGRANVDQLRAGALAPAAPSCDTAPLLNRSW